MRCLPGEEYADLEIAATAALHLDDDDDDDDDDVYIEDCKGEGQRKCVFCESRFLHFVHCNRKRRIPSVIHTLTPDREI